MGPPSCIENWNKLFLFGVPPSSGLGHPPVGQLPFLSICGLALNDSGQWEGLYETHPYWVGGHGLVVGLDSLENPLHRFPWIHCDPHYLFQTVRMFDRHRITLSCISLIFLNHPHFFDSQKLRNHMLGGTDCTKCVEGRPSYDDVICGGLVNDHEGCHLVALLDVSLRKGEGQSFRRATWRS